MSKASSIDALPEEIRAEIGRLMTQGATIDRIVEHLRALVGSRDGVDAPSRSAVGRHVKKMQVVGDRLRRSRDVAEALVRELGDAPVSKTAQLNIELLHGAVFDLFNGGALGDALSEGEIDEGGKAALAGNPQGMMMLAKALDHLTRASKSDVDYRAQVEKRAEERARKAAAEAAETVAKAEGVSIATMAKIKAGIFGVRA